MEEYNPRSTAETDPSDDDDDDEKETDGKRASSTKASRVIIEKMAAEKPAEKKEPEVPSLAERIFQKKEEKPAENDAGETQPDEDEERPEEAAISREESSDEERPELVEIEVNDGVTGVEHDLTEDDQAELAASESIPESREEAWDEGEITEDGEINLSRPVAEEVEDTPASTETAEPEPVQSETDSSTAEDTGPEPQASGGNGGEGPPPEAPEETPEDTAEPDGGRPVRPAFGSTEDFRAFGPPSERFTREIDTRATEDAMNEAIYRATKSGQNRGVLAGLLGGLYIGHRGKKKLAHKFDKAIEAKDTEIKQLKNDQAAASGRLGSLESTKAQLRAVMAEKPREGTQLSPKMPLMEAVRAEKESESDAGPFMRIESVPGAPLSKRLETLSAAPLVIGAETLRRRLSGRERVRYAVDERGNMTVVRGGEQTPGKELPPEEKAITEELFVTPDGRRVEMSSWHRIEIDQKTGKVVRNPEVEYGEEFQRETRQEVLKNQRSRDGRGAALQLGNMASASASVPDPQPAMSNAAVPAVPLTSQAGEPVQTMVKNDDNDEPMDPLVWVIVSIFVVILFLFAILR